jgi:hypothetical protein
MIVIFTNIFPKEKKCFLEWTHLTKLHIFYKTLYHGVFRRLTLKT